MSMTSHASHPDQHQTLLLSSASPSCVLEFGFADIFFVPGPLVSTRRRWLFRIHAGCAVFAFEKLPSVKGEYHFIAVASEIAQERSPWQTLTETTSSVTPSALLWCEALQTYLQTHTSEAEKQVLPFAPLSSERQQLQHALVQLCLTQRSAISNSWQDQRPQFDAEQVSHALHTLVNVKTSNTIQPLRVGANALTRNLQLLLTLQAIDTTNATWPKASPDLDGREQALQILSHVNATYRQVLLRPDWSEKSAPPMLGFWGADKHPVVLEHKRGVWWMHDDGKQTRIDPDQSQAIHEQGLADTALQIYPTFSAHALRFRELINFGLKASRAHQMRIGLLITGIALMGMVTPYMSRLLLSDAIPYSNFSLTSMIVIALLALTLTRLVLSIVIAQAKLSLETQFEQRVQPALLERLLRLPLTFFRRYSSGEITDRLLGIHEARTVVMGAMTGAVLSGSFGILSLLPVLWVDIRLGAVIFLLACLLGLVEFIFGRIMLSIQREASTQRGRIESYVLQMLMGIAKLRVSAAHKLAYVRWLGLFKTNTDLHQRLLSWGRLQSVFLLFLPVLATVVLYVSILHCIEIDMQKKPPPPAFSLADFITITTAFGQLMGSISGLAGALISALAAVPLIERARPIIEEAPELSAQTNAEIVLRGDIHVRDVSFRYGKDSPAALTNLSLHIPQGQFLAIVGASGCGKSTLLRILLGFERPESGEVFYDGHALARLDLQRLRKQIGVVLQHGRLIAGSLHENIVADSGLGLEDAMRAASCVGLDADIAQMPMGLHTVIQDGGSTLSGGQRQRVLLARALIHQPRVVLLDEATSALDNRTQAVVTQTLRNLDATRIVIAHRLSTIEQVDRIVMLDKGVIVETGSYTELMQANGLFAAHAKRQLIKEI